MQLTRLGRCLTIAAVTLTIPFVSLWVSAADANPALQKVRYSEPTLSNKELRSLMNWAVHLSGYPQPETLPTLRVVDHSYMVENACYGQECKVLGWYNDQGIVYIDAETLRQDSLFTRSLVIHELIHHLQYLSGKFNSSCDDVAAREAEAYRFQQQFFTENGSLSPLRIHLHHCNPEAEKVLTYRTKAQLNRPRL